MGIVLLPDILNMACWDRFNTAKQVTNFDIFFYPEMQEYMKEQCLPLALL